VFSFSDPRVYLEIDENRLFIGRLKKRKGYFLCDRFDEWPLTAFEVKDGVIYKPSVLYLLIRSFLKDHHLKGTKAVVCCPYLAYWKGVDKRMPFFQAALYVSKAGLKIHSMLSEGVLTEQSGVDESKFFHKDKLKNRFDFFCHFRLKHKKAILQWLGGSAGLFAGICIGLSALHVVAHRRKVSLQNDRSELGERVAVLKKKVDGVSGYAAKNKFLKQELAKFEQIKNKRWGIVSFLQSLSSSIPPNTWLDTIDFDHEGVKKGTKGDVIKLKGYSIKSEEVMAFYKDVVGKGVLDGCSLKYGQAEVAGQERPELFSFTISGRVV